MDLTLVAFLLLVVLSTAAGNESESYVSPPVAGPPLRDLLEKQSISPSDIRVVFSDLDDTFYPQGREPEQQVKWNMYYADMLKRLLLPVPTVVATGNNLKLAEAKLGKSIYDQPGIFSGGALVLGQGGLNKVLRDSSPIFEAPVSNIPVNAKDAVAGGFVEYLLKMWPRRPVSQTCLIGLSRSDVLYLELEDPDLLKRCKEQLTDKMNLHAVQSPYVVLSQKQFLEQKEIILSLHVLFLIKIEPSHTKPLTGLGENEVLVVNPGSSANVTSVEEALKNMKVFEASPWMKDLLEQYSPAVKPIAAEPNAMTKMGPVIDFSDGGVNKGSSMVRFLQASEPTLKGLEGDTLEQELHRFSKFVAVFGDAANDIELFGYNLKTGKPSEGLAKGLVPALSVAMPWSTSEVLKSKASVFFDAIEYAGTPEVRFPVAVVLQLIYEAQAQSKLPLYFLAVLRAAYALW